MASKARLHWFWRGAAALAVLLVLGLAFFVSSTSQNRQRTVDLIQGTKPMIAHFRALFSTGQVMEPIMSGGVHIDPERLGTPLLLIQMKLPRQVSKYVTPGSTQAAALAELAAANRLIETQIWPSYEKALRSKDPVDAKALVPLMDQLDKHMDKLLQIRKDY